MWCTANEVAFDGAMEAGFKSPTNHGNAGRVHKGADSVICRVLLDVGIQKSYKAGTCSRLLAGLMISASSICARSIATEQLIEASEPLPEPAA